MNYRVGDKVVCLINLQYDYGILVGDLGLVVELIEDSISPYNLHILFPGKNTIGMRYSEIAPATPLHKFLFGLDTDQQTDYNISKEIEK